MVSGRAYVQNIKQRIIHVNGMVAMTVNHEFVIRCGLNHRIFSTGTVLMYYGRSTFNFTS